MVNSNGSIHMNYHFITIEGNIGAGKTTLAHLLARHYNARVVLEEFADNPFLAKFYENRRQFAFPLELFFMERHGGEHLLDVVECLPGPFCPRRLPVFANLVFSLPGIFFYQHHRVLDHVGCVGRFSLLLAAPF